MRTAHISNDKVIFYPLKVAIMKNSLIIAAAALLGSAAADVHRMKLQKVPLSQQLVSH